MWSQGGKFGRGKIPHKGKDSTQMMEAKCRREQRCHLAASCGEGRSGPAGQDLEGALLVDPLLFEAGF
jgi:hypothetical protein